MDTASEIVGSAVEILHMHWARRIALLVEWSGIERNGQSMAEWWWGNGHDYPSRHGRIIDDPV